MNDAVAVQAPPRLPDLPVGSPGRRSSGWFGMWYAIATESALFSYLLFSYFYSTAFAPAPWPPDGLPKLQLALPNTFVLLASSLALWWGERSIRRGAQGRLLLGMAGALVLGTIFAVVQVLEWHDKPFSFGSGLYASLFFTITGFHFAHVVVGLIVLAALTLWTALGYFDRKRHTAVTVGGLYWHFVDAVWIVVFTALYLTPYWWGTS